MTARPMEEIPECEVCGLEIWGGKGDWWHGSPETEPSVGHIAIPKRRPAPLAPLIERANAEIERLRSEIDRWEEWRDELLRMQEQESNTTTERGT